MRRAVSAILAGNALGLVAWTLGWRALPLVWAGVNEDAGLGALMARVAVSAMMMAAPPVLIGALSAWLARRAQLWVGLASGLWGLTLIRATPDEFPILSQVWFAPTVLVLLSTALGGWMMDLREQARSVRRDP
jgi:hypothetical protein